MLAERKPVQPVRRQASRNTPSRPGARGSVLATNIPSERLLPNTRPHRPQMATGPTRLRLSRCSTHVVLPALAPSVSVAVVAFYTSWARLAVVYHTIFNRHRPIKQNSRRRSRHRAKGAIVVARQADHHTAPTSVEGWNATEPPNQACGRGQRSPARRPYRA